jgi:DNA-binding transcriptional ArsR family regulator
MAYHDGALDRLFHALADPTRRGIVERLLKGEASVGELAAPTGMALPTILRHIAVLEKTGLVVTTKAGRTRICRVSPQPLDEARSWLEARRQEWESRLDRLEAYLATLPPEAPDERS